MSPKFEASLLAIFLKIRRIILPERVFGTALNKDQTTWILAGWREEIVLNETGVNVVQQDEVVMQHIIKEEQLWLLTNDGLLTHSILTE